MIVQGLYIWNAPHPLASQLSIALCVCGVWEQPQAYSNSHIPQSKIQAPTCWCVGASIKRDEIKMNSTMRPSIGQVSLVEYFLGGGSCRRASPHLHLIDVSCASCRHQGMGDTQPQMVYVRHCCPRDFAGLALGFGVWGCWGGGYLGIQDEIRHERIHESRLRWITIYQYVFESGSFILPFDSHCHGSVFTWSKLVKERIVGRVGICFSNFHDSWSQCTEFWWTPGWMQRYKNLGTRCLDILDVAMSQATRFNQENVPKADEFMNHQCSLGVFLLLELGCCRLISQQNVTNDKRFPKDQLDSSDTSCQEGLEHCHTRRLVMTIKFMQQPIHQPTHYHMH